MYSLLFSLLAPSCVEKNKVEALAEPPPPPKVAIPFEKYELENGLDVILAEDHSVPFVQVNIWYDVGSKDEEEGKAFSLAVSA